MVKKRAAGTSKSAAIRDFLAKNPESKASEVAATLKVKPQLVYFVKSQMKRKVRKAKRAKAVAAGRDAGLSDPITLIRKIRGLSVEAGGMKKLKELVDVLAE
ncbi:hypothetical protein AYO40_01725 [Planctomycetaceae bacterium SCGC AG-212-D15]|nr:hypothetical protein AYO40_01725 [Planctomycetaceae bacterium SCGC AG-212-D15]